MLECNSKGRAVKGIEVGRGGFGIRGVVPVTDKTGPIGSFEIGLGLAPILEEFKKTTGASVSVFADIAVQGRVTWDERTERGKTIGIYRHIHSTDTALMEHLVTEADLAVSSMRISKASSDQTEYGVSYFPLKDFGGKRVGIAVIAKDFSEFTGQSTQAARSSLVLVAVGLGFLVLVVLMVVNALVVVPLRKISAAADEVSTGKVHTTITMTGRRDEIGTIAKSFDRMRISLEKAMESLERMGG